MEKSILIIDDEFSVRNSFVLALEDAPYDVVAADSGEKGLELFKARQIDLIYLDLKMPGMSGIETLREIRKINTDVPVYIITAFAKEFFDGLQQLAKDNIEFELIQKPIGLDAINEITTALLA